MSEWEVFAAVDAATQKLQTTAGCARSGLPNQARQQPILPHQTQTQSSLNPNAAAEAGAGAGLQRNLSPQQGPKHGPDAS